jgi:hypothetical protein
VVGGSATLRAACPDTEYSQMPASLAAIGVAPGVSDGEAADAAAGDAGGLGVCGVTGICPHPLISTATTMITSAGARTVLSTVVLCHNAEGLPGSDRPVFVAPQHPSA